MIPDLKGKLDGISIRVPTPNVSVVDFKFVAKRATTKEEINAAIKAAAEGALKDILGYTDAPNVSMDFNHDPRSSIFHNDQTKVMEGKFCSVLSLVRQRVGLLEPHGRHGRGDGEADLKLRLPTLTAFGKAQLFGMALGGLATAPFVLSWNFSLRTYLGGWVAAWVATEFAFGMRLMAHAKDNLAWFAIAAAMGAVAPATGLLIAVLTKA